MSWSVQIGRLFGIPVRLHLTFLLLMGWLAYRGALSGEMTGVLLAASLFACVLAHELGHSVVAQRYGVKVVDITLLPIGGVARMASIPDKPRQEFWIAVAGPAVNLVIAPILYLAHWLILGPIPLHHLMHFGLGDPLSQVAQLNLFMALFNLIPAFPMDGGRILRALLAERMPYALATHKAASLGQLVAILLGFYGLLQGNPVLILIALFVFMGAGDEAQRAQTHAFVEGVPVREAMLTEFDTLRRADNLGRAVDLLLAGTQQEFPVLEGTEVVGVLSRRRLLEALSRGGREIYVGEVMEPAPPAVDPDSPLDAVLDQMATGGQTMVPVVSSQGLCGLLTMENTMEFMLVRAALMSRGAPAGRSA